MIVQKYIKHLKIPFQRESFFQIISIFVLTMQIEMERSSKYSVWGMLILLISVFSACSSTYQITGNSDITTLDGKYLSLRTLQNGHWVEVDSAEVVHGLFSMNGKVDTTRMVTIYFDNQGIMPIILENGDINVSISNQTMFAGGTPLNDALYDFIRVRNSMERQLGILNSREARLIMEGANPDFIHMQIQEEIDSLNRQMNAYARSFISDNFNNILGPSVFMMMCSTLPYPILTDEIEAILNSAPESFLNQEWVKDFVSKAKENQQLIEENRRLMQSLEEERILQQHQQQITNSGGH